MSGILKNERKRILVNKTSRQITAINTELDVDLYINDALSLGYEFDKDDFKSFLNSNLSLEEKSGVNVLLHPYVYKKNTICAINGDSRTVDFFNFTRASKGSTFNHKGELVLVDEHLPRVYYAPNDLLFEGFLMEKGSMNLYPNSLCLDGVPTEWGRGDLLAHGYKLPSTHEKVINVNLFENKVYNFSFFVKLDSNVKPIIDNVINSDIWFNFMDYVRKFDIVNKGQGLYRLSFEIADFSTNKIIIKNNKFNQFLAESITMSGFQLEEGSVMTSYIPTNGSVTYRLPDKIVSQRDIVVFSKNSIIINDDYFELNDLPFTYSDFIDVDIYGRMKLQSKNINKFKYLCFFDSTR